MPNTPDGSIEINVNLARLPITRRSFGALLYIVTETGNSLDGETVFPVANAEAARAAQTAGFITTTVRDALIAAFSQGRDIESIKLTTAAAAAYDTAYSDARAADDDFYGVALDSNLAADVVEVSVAIEADASATDSRANKILLARSEDADWLTVGAPAAYSSILANERTAVVFHNTTAVPAGLVWAANRLAFDQDVQSAPWSAGLRGIDAYNPAVTDAELAIAIANNANVIFPFGTEPTFLDPGVNIRGRALYQLPTADWYQARVEEDLVALRVYQTGRGVKTFVDERGQASILKILNRWLSAGVEAGHFLPGQFVAAGETITDDDRTNRRLRFRVNSTIAQDARNFVINVYQDTSLSV